ncbi:MAG: hypothetical protein QGG73_04000 [Candidatus Hydrogenedentes bacterium]|jgi:hypothetical protein|nr:hypothetical protein [Candidatus Hydrogenedentota bacterium]
MSSILDALKKLEEEKALEDLLGDSADSSAEAMPPEPVRVGGLVPDSWRLELTPGRLTAIMGGTVLALTLISVLITYLLLRPGAGSEASAIAAAEPESSPSVSIAQAVAVLVEDPLPERSIREEVRALPASPEPIAEELPRPTVEPVLEEPASSSPEPVRATPAAATAQPPTVQARAVAPRPTTPIEREKASAPKRATAPEPVFDARDLRVEPVRTPAVKPAQPESRVRTVRTEAAFPSRGYSSRSRESARALPPPKAKNPVPIEKLPLLSTTVRMRYGLEDLRVNMLVIKGPHTPRTVAIINHLPINEGETIPKTRVELIKIESHGIAIKIIETGDQYYIPS